MKKFNFCLLSLILVSSILGAQSITISQQFLFNPDKSVQLNNPDIQMMRDSSLLVHKVIVGTQKGSTFSRGCPKKVRKNCDITEIKLNTDTIAYNTHTTWCGENWNLVAMVSIIFSILAMGLSYLTLCINNCTFHSQKKTEINTLNAPLDVQLGVLKDLPRHFYRNLVCTRAIYLKYISEGLNSIGWTKNREKYPSESNVRKLQTMPDEIFLAIDVQEGNKGKDNPYMIMHNCKLLLRNYNLEVEVASDHLSRKEISEQSMGQDFDNLFYKPLYLVKRLFDYQQSLEPKSKDLIVVNTIITIVNSHFKNIRDSSNFKLLFGNQYVEGLANKDFLVVDYIKPGSIEGSIERSLNPLLKYGQKKEGIIIDEINKEAALNINCRHRFTDWLTGFRTDEKVTEHYENSENILEITIRISDVYEASIKRDEFLRKLLEDKKEEEKYFLHGKNGNKGFLNISSQDDFIAFCKDQKFINETPREQEKAQKLYECLSPYLNYLHEGTWNFRTLFNFMLAIDAAIETERIGMIEYR